MRALKYGKHLEGSSSRLLWIKQVLLVDLPTHIKDKIYMGSYHDIRPYHDSEVNSYIQRLLNDDSFLQVMSYAYNGDESKIKHAASTLAQVQTRNELQQKFMRPIIEEWIINRTTCGVTCSGLDKLDKSKGYLFISNHRDIILDAAIMNFLMAKEGLDTTEIAIGDNLLIHDWILHLVKLNGAFEVKRNLPVRELLMASKKMSAYIRERITENNISVWIAQREGRTKDGNDQTQQALLKMFNLSNKLDFAAGFEELNIVPLTISYEREPCGISKVEELYKKKVDGSFEKTQEDDLMSMALGLMLPKGRVHFAFGNPINVNDTIGDSTNANANYKLLADAIDHEIYSNYQLFPFNFLAVDMLRGEDRYEHKVDDASRAKFDELLNDLVQTIGEGDAELQKQMFIEMYAMPVLNYEKI
ncbi:MAG: 1-acyl-sn-glycerol-3-phosphate acyltransferase [Mangrovibacterium sp.]